ncbi:MAG: ABC transporter ATP-binding protein [Archaeoglobaceae archaeon]|nr:ABC transporter ATP-binding protein [Archaeoglobaceae archaeon]MDW7989115.1 ABC transporter ATP-binding protein [Archaeoglobaceae archaeon]
MLRLIDISKNFGGLKVLDRISLEMKKEKLGIIGPNGAGKTTLFNIISGFLKPDSGKIFFMNENIIGKKPSDLAKLGIIRTFQIVKVFENLTVEENILTIVDDLSILKDFDLEEKRKEKAKNLSQGEIRRLSIALALVRRPKILLLDEPFSGLSKKEAEKILTIINEIGGNGTSIAIVEHRMREMFDAVDRVVVLNGGKLIFDGYPEDALENKSVREAYFGSKYVKG